MRSEPRRIRIDLAYDGTDFHGWQIQPGKRTVQGLLESSLARVAGERPVKVRGAGRTDAGAHARRQVADAALATRLDDAALTRALRRMLPPDVGVLGVCTVDGNFHARRDALSKTYVYRIDRSESGDPFLARYALPHPEPLDRERMRDALARLPGRRDWSGFTDSACEVQDRVRTLSEAVLRDLTAAVEGFVFTADGFLTHMVRNIVGTVLEIGRGRFPPERIDAILAGRDRRRAGPSVPARGLCLEDVRYAPSPREP